MRETVVIRGVLLCAEGLYKPAWKRRGEATDADCAADVEVTAIRDLGGQDLTDLLSMDTRLRVHEAAREKVEEWLL